MPISELRPGAHFRVHPNDPVGYIKVSGTARCWAAPVPTGDDRPQLIAFPGDTLAHSLKDVSIWRTC